MLETLQIEANNGVSLLGFGHNDAYFVAHVLRIGCQYINVWHRLYGNGYDLSRFGGRQASQPPRIGLDVQDKVNKIYIN